MTVSNARPLPAASSPAAAVGALRARGLRVSAARRLVLEALYTAEGPVSAEAVAGGLDGRLPPSDLGSVYRNLDTLEETGLVQHVHLGHGRAVYHLTDQPHQHLVCEGCGLVVEVPDEQFAALRADLRDRYAFTIRPNHFAVLGRCERCAATSR